MRILLISDAWTPQVNGVVMTLRNTVRCLQGLGHDVQVLAPDRFRTVPCPTYPEIRLALRPAKTLAATLASFQPEAVHIATEGPLGLAGRSACRRAGIRYTTAYHTRFPEYVHARTRLPLRIGYAWMRRFHSDSHAVMVATPALHVELERRGFGNLARWTRGVDTDLFKPGPVMDVDWPRPVFMYVGRVAVEKNIGAFLSLDLPGSKVVVGDGPQRSALERLHPEVRFLGVKHGEALAACFRSADCFVFPSLTDTFGLVLLEAMASGTPVAAYPVTGPIDVVQCGVSGVLDRDLRAAALRALELDREAVRAHALRYSWSAATQQFLGNLYRNDVPVRRSAGAA